MIEVTHDGESEFSPAERCCFCREKTRYWSVDKDVACCQTCARKADLKDLPSKKVWCRREEIAMKSVSGRHRY